MMDGNDYRARAGLASWQEGSGPGLFEVTTEDAAGARERLVTNVRRLAGADRTPGSALIGAAGWLLTVLAAGLLAVSYAGQFAYIFAARGQVIASNIEAAMFDVGMVIFSLLALGLARAGKPARTERMLILVCALGSAGMGFAAADVTSPRSVAAYVAPPLFLAVVVDRVIAVVRRHILGDDESSPWAPLGRLTLRAIRLIGVVLLYALRLLLDLRPTARGLRQLVLDAAPVPAPPVQVPRWEPLPCLGAGFADPCPNPAPCPDHPAITVAASPDGAAHGGTKKARLLALYRAHPDYGDRSRASRAATELAAAAGLQPGTARSYIYAALSETEAAG